MKVILQGHIIETDMIVAINKPRQNSNSFEIICVGPNTITIKSDTHTPPLPLSEEMKELYNKYNSMSGKVSEDQARKCSDLVQLYCDKADEQYALNVKAAHAMYEALVEVWSHNSPHLDLTVTAPKIIYETILQ